MLLGLISVAPLILSPVAYAASVQNIENQDSLPEKRPIEILILNTAATPEQDAKHWESLVNEIYDIAHGETIAEIASASASIDVESLKARGVHTVIFAGGGVSENREMLETVLQSDLGLVLSTPEGEKIVSSETQPQKRLCQIETPEIETDGVGFKVDQHLVKCLFQTMKEDTKIERFAKSLTSTQHDILNVDELMQTEHHTRSEARKLVKLVIDGDIKKRLTDEVESLLAAKFNNEEEAVQQSLEEFHKLLQAIDSVAHKIERTKVNTRLLNIFAEPLAIAKAAKMANHRHFHTGYEDVLVKVLDKEIKELLHKIYHCDIDTSACIYEGSQLDDKSNARASELMHSKSDKK